MKQLSLIAAALLLSACAGNDNKADDAPDAVADFIQLHNLQKQSRVRDFSNPGSLPVNTRYIIAYVDDAQYLVAYAHECRFASKAMSDRPFDKRRYANQLWARTDSYRGCPIKAIYPITLGQTQELMNMGRAPGE